MEQEQRRNAIIINDIYKRDRLGLRWFGGGQAGRVKEAINWTKNCLVKKNYSKTETEEAKERSVGRQEQTGRTAT